MSQTDALLREVAILYTQAQRTTAACCDVKSQTQCMVITELGRHEPLTPLELAERLGFEKSWMGRVVGQLEAEGLVAKFPNQADGRSYLLRLTPAGNARFEQLNLILNAHAERLMDFIPPDQRAMVQEALLLVRDALLAEAHTLEAIASNCMID
ncbi:MAG: MarR family transcriptional regulator [Chloroflexi bacterium]|nr:MarR family transcriptional regulator [Chloroflexota bacterium]